MYSMARIVLLIHQTVASGHLVYLSRDRVINECIDNIGGVAMGVTDDASRIVSMQTLFVAGFYCTDAAKHICIAELMKDCQIGTGWPSNDSLVEELRTRWA